MLRPSCIDHMQRPHDACMHTISCLWHAKRIRLHAPLSVTDRTVQVRTHVKLPHLTLTHSDTLHFAMSNFDQDSPPGINGCGNGAVGCCAHIVDNAIHCPAGCGVDVEKGVVAVSGLAPGEVDTRRVGGHPGRACVSVGSS